ncbi:DUF4352 domain-containing protein [Candidatus Bathyarchaeota archaeon]|nr:DUF4352 domain-containing protein [Candidatus Bathyarchaeota archaeon]
MSRTRRSFRRGRRGISPVISTIIIVAVAIAISIAVAFWLGGITAIFTRFEKLEITSAYATSYEDSENYNWTVKLIVKNTGTSDATIENILINNIPYTDYGTSGVDINWSLPISLPTGEDVAIEIYINATAGDYTFAHGQSVTITLHTAGGQDYPKTVALP